MTGDLNDFMGRLKCVLPKRWFADNTPILDALLNCIATSWAWFYQALSYAQQQTRIATATDIWLDLIAIDFFGACLPRRSAESDISYRYRINQNLLRPAATRQALLDALTTLTGSTPSIFEPGKSGDTGGYGSAEVGSGAGYGVAGGWGSIDLPLQFFVTAFRPSTPGISLLAGYGSGGGCYGGGSIAFTDLASLPGQITDADIEQIVAGILPVNTIAWLRII